MCIYIYLSTFHWFFFPDWPPKMIVISKVWALVPRPGAWTQGPGYHSYP